MRARAVAATMLVLAAAAGAARAQQQGGGAAAGPAEARAPVCAPDGGAGACGAPAAAVTDAPDAAPEEPAANVSRAGERDACSEVLRAVQFEDVAGAERAYAACRARVARPGRIPVADDVRALEDATEALHGLRRDDGSFCVAPAAPFDLGVMMAGAADTRACLAALDRLLSSDNAVWRFVLADAYASGRLAARAGYDVVTARRTRRRPLSGSAAERELLSIARLAGRHFMRACRCLPGPQPDSVTSVRAMRLPSTVEAALLRGLEEREEAHAEP